MGKSSVWKIITLAIVIGVLIIGGSIGMGLGIKRSYSIEVASNIEEAQFIGGGSYKVGDKVTFETNKVDGYRFMGWKFKSIIASIDNPYTFTLSKNNAGSYLAFYEREYNLSKVEDDNGEISLSPQKAVYGEEITITITPSQGYEIQHLYYAEGDSYEYIDIEDNKFYMPRNDVTVYATFKSINNQG